MRRRYEIHVVAGVLSDEAGRVLVAQRPTGKHLAGRWEFPGGKLAEGEEPLAGLKRELAEELGVILKSAEPLIRLRHAYSNRDILLDVWQVTAYSGTPQGLDDQALEWVSPDDLPDVDLLEADQSIITVLRLPRVARCVAGTEGLVEATRGKGPETLFWDPRDADPASEPVREAVRAARRAGYRVIVTGEDIQAAMTAAASGADGMLLEPSDGMVTIDSSGAFIVGAICPTPAAAEAAMAAGAHFLVLTPGSDAADKKRFAGLIERLGLPAYMGWFRDARSLGPARASGAHGCAIGPAAAR